MDSRGGLGGKETNLLQRHWKTLKQDIRMADIVDNLIVEGVLKPEIWEDLKRKYKTEKERTEEFLLMLQRKSSKSFVIFREALRDNGYEHLAEKLDFVEERKQKTSKSENHYVSEQSTPIGATAVDTSAILKTLKDLCDKDKQRDIELAAMKQEQEKSSQKLERKLASNLQQTNEELNKLKESLRQKEDEIEKLKLIQRQHEETNRDLSDENRKLESEREAMLGELQLKKSERDEMELKMKRQRLYEDKIMREKDKLKKTIERQKTQLEQEMQEKSKAMDSLQREKTTLELIKKEKDELQEKIEALEDENEILSSTTSRPQTSMTQWTLSSSRDMDDSSMTLYRRQPTGLSESDDNTSMSQLLDERSTIEAEIKRKQLEQKYLKRKLRALKSHPGVEESQRKSPNCFVAFREALHENGYEHLVAKLDFKEERKQKTSKTQNHYASEQGTSIGATSADTSEILKNLKDLWEKDKQRDIELAAMKQEQEKSSQKLERKLASNLQQTNEELNKLKESLRQKEDEIEKLKLIQREHEETNRDLSDENRKLESEMEAMFGELQLKKSERDEMELKMKRQKLYEDKIMREKETLKKTIERQKTQLEQEMQEKSQVMDCLQREKTSLELIKREKDELQEKIEALEDENEILSTRPQTSMTQWTLSSSRDTEDSSMALYRRQPTGLSESDDNTSMSQLLDQRSAIEAEIKKKTNRAEMFNKETKGIKISSRRRRKSGVRCSIVRNSRVVQCSLH